MKVLVARWLIQLVRRICQLLGHPLAGQTERPVELLLLMAATTPELLRIDSVTNPSASVAIAGWFKAATNVAAR